jgi:hypothetical protein
MEGAVGDRFVVTGRPPGAVGERVAIFWDWTTEPR